VEVSICFTACTIGYFRFLINTSVAYSSVTRGESAFSEMESAEDAEGTMAFCSVVVYILLHILGTPLVEVKFRSILN
jgi:hypothetical protein